MEQYPKAQPVHEEVSPPVPLTAVQVGTLVRVDGVRAGRGLQARLAAMGIFPGTVIEVVRRPLALQGPFIVRRGASKLMLGYGMAQKLFVRL